MVYQNQSKLNTSFALLIGVSLSWHSVGIALIQSELPINHLLKKPQLVTGKKYWAMVSLILWIKIWSRPFFFLPFIISFLREISVISVLFHLKIIKKNISMYKLINRSRCTSILYCFRHSKLKTRLSTQGFVNYLWYLCFLEELFVVPNEASNLVPQKIFSVQKKNEKVLW